MGKTQGVNKANSPPPNPNKNSIQIPLRSFSLQLLSPNSPSSKSFFSRLDAEIAEQSPRLSLTEGYP